MARTPFVSAPRRGIAGIPSTLVGAAIIVLVVGVLGVTGVLAQAIQLVPGLRQPAPTYQMATVKRGNVAVSVVATGPIATTQTVPLTFKTSGKLADLKVQVGQQVSKGQVLATLDTSDLQTALEQAQANLTQAQANLAKL